MPEDRRFEERLARRGGIVEMLRLPAAVFEAVSRARRSLYERGWLPSERVGMTVISVGNLSVGGTGKTPMVALLAKELAKRGRRVGLLSRGYRAEAAASEAGASATAEPTRIKNDEARELERSLGAEVPHVQGADRVAGARELKGLGVDVAILDDGFQHRRLARDLDLVLVDASRPFGLPAADGAEPVEALLPRGFLREPADALRFAQACVVTRSDQVAPEVLARLEERLDTTAPGLPILLAKHQPVALLDLEGEGEVDLRTQPDALRGKRIAALSGIGNPQAFCRTLKDLGAEVVLELRKADHAACGDEDRAFIETARSQSLMVVTTAKDAVKLSGVLGDVSGAAVKVLLVEQTIVRGSSVLEALLDALPRPRKSPGSARGDARVTDGSQAKSAVAEVSWPVPKQEVLGDRGGLFAWLEFGAMRCVVVGFSLLPEFLLLPLIGALARLGKLIDKRHARAAADYLRTALPAENESQIDARVLQAYRHLLGLTVRGERWARRIRSWKGDEWREHVEVEMAPRAKEAIEREGGLLLVGAHLGDWEIGSAFIPRILAPRPIYIVSRPPRNRPMSIQAQRQREARGVRLLPRRGSMQSVRAVVEGGGGLCLLLDQRARQRPIYAPFFGRRARCDRSAGVLLKRLRVPVVFANCTLLPAGHPSGKTFRMSFSEALLPEDLRGQGPVEIATLVNQELGKRILESPDQYFWLHDRYRGGEDPAEEGSA